MEEALKYFKQSYEMRSRLYNNKDHVNLIESLNNISYSFERLNNKQEAIKYNNLSTQMKLRLNV